MMSCPYHDGECYFEKCTWYIEKLCVFIFPIGHQESLNRYC